MKNRVAGSAGSARSIDTLEREIELRHRAIESGLSYGNKTAITNDLPELASLIGSELLSGPQRRARSLPVALLGAAAALWAVDRFHGMKSSSSPDEQEETKASHKRDALKRHPLIVAAACVALGALAGSVTWAGVVSKRSDDD